MVTSHHGALVLIACLCLALLPRPSGAAVVGVPQFSRLDTQMHRYHDPASIYSLDKLAPHTLEAPPSLLARLEPLPLALVSAGQRQRATSNAVEGAEEGMRENGGQEPPLFQNFPDPADDIALLLADTLGAQKLGLPEERDAAALRAAAAAVLASPPHTNKIDSPQYLYDPQQPPQPQAQPQPHPQPLQQQAEGEMVGEKVEVKKWWGKQYRPLYKETRRTSYNRKKSTHYACMKKCIAGGKLHPIQCHSLC